MANPRRSSSVQFHHNPILPLSSSDLNPQQHQHQPSFSLTHLFSSLGSFLKRPQAFPFLLSTFVFLTWLSLRFQYHSPYSSSTVQAPDRQFGVVDPHANLVRFSAADAPSRIARDHRGWLLNPVAAALDAGVFGGAQSCASVHVGEIRPGGIRGNHRHHTCNETFIIWGAATKFRLENVHGETMAYAEALVGADEVAIAASPSGTAHALINVDRARSTFFLGCQDTVLGNDTSSTNYNVWHDFR